MVIAVPVTLLVRKLSKMDANAGSSGAEAGAAAKPAVRPPSSAGSGKKVNGDELPAVDLSKDKEQVQAEIADLSTQYDASAVKPLAAYLYHTDPEIRASARNGLIQLGEAGAVPYLRKAAKEELDPHEAKQLLEAAEFLELPPEPLKPKSAKPKQ